MITAYSHSESGGHSVNEDTFVVQQHPDDLEFWICTLADGQGGCAGGGPASRLACKTVMDLAAAEPKSRLLDARTWEAILHRADETVSADASAGFTTLIGFCLAYNKVCGGSNGDSAAAIFDKTRMCEEPTQSLTKFQVKNPPIGSGAAAVVPFAADLRCPWMVLTMSDGVWKYARWDKIKEAAQGVPRSRADRCDQASGNADAIRQTPGRLHACRFAKRRGVKFLTCGGVKMSTITADSTLLLVLSQMKDVTEIRDANGNLVGVYTPKGKTDEEIKKLFDLDKARQKLATEKARPFREMIDKLAEKKG